VTVGNASVSPAVAKMYGALWNTVADFIGTILKVRNQERRYGRGHSAAVLAEDLDC